MPQEVVRRILDHDSAEMTALYAVVSDTTIRLPAGQRASDASLLRRLQAAHVEHRQLLEERARLLEERDRLRRQIARALGERRQTGNQPPF